MSSTASLSAEYRAITVSCGLLDRSERGKLALTGSDAKSFLQGQVTNDVESLTPGTGCYAAFLTPKGKMLGDLRILDTGDELLLDTERAALQPLFNMIRRFSIGYDVQLLKRTLERGLVSLIGPLAAEVAAAPELSDAPEHSHVQTEVGRGGARAIPTEVGRGGARAIRTDVGRIGARAIRTEVGVDLLCESGALGALRSALEASGATPVDEPVVECLRVERGQPRYGFELDDTVIPQEAGLNDRAVSFTKGCYVGQETVARLHYRGKPNRHLRGLRLSGPARTGDPVRLGERQVGQLGSIAESPRFGWIALSVVRREAPVGSSVTVGGGVSAEVVELPFS